MNHLPIRNLIALVILRIMNQNPRKNLKMKVTHQRQILLKIRVKNLSKKRLKKKASQKVAKNRQKKKM